MPTTIETANKITEEFTLLSNVYRTLIIMYLYKNKDYSTWSEIKEYIEKISGKVNPNTLHFHLKALLHAGWINRSGSPDLSIYKINKDKIPESILQTIIKKI